MPELPEIETVKRTLTPHVIGRTIQTVTLLQPAVVAYPAADAFAERLQGVVITALSRRGKYLLLHMADGQTLVVHLRMTGRLLYAPADHPMPRHTHAVFALDNGHQLRFADQRRFGRLWLLAEGEADSVTGMQNLGVEPLTTAFHAGLLQEKLGRRRVAIKTALLDQHVIAGLGNIYVDETLFRAGIHPARLCCTLTAEEWEAIACVVPQVLQQAIANNGTTFRDFLDGEGREGENMPFLHAYGRVGQPCRTCGTQMQRLCIGGRGTCYCPHCQKEGECV